MRSGRQHLSGSVDKLINIFGLVDTGIVVRGQKKPSRASVSGIICILVKKSVAGGIDHLVYIA